MSKLTPKQKKEINDAVFYILIGAIICLTIKAYFIYQAYGFGYCIEETDSLTENRTITCFNTSEERKGYLENISDSWANNLDYKYINTEPYNINIS